MKSLYEAIHAIPRTSTKSIMTRYGISYNVHTKGSRAALTTQIRSPLIHDEACPDCKYREMCTESLAEEVKR